MLKSLQRVLPALVLGELYEDALTNLGFFHELAAYWRARAAQAGATAEAKRSFAVKLVAVGWKE